MDKPYFASLAERALQAEATQNVLSKLQGEVATLPTQWEYKLPQPSVPGLRSFECSISPWLQSLPMRTQCTRRWQIFIPRKDSQCQVPSDALVALLGISHAA
jgi:hypothetical protein